MVYVHVMQVLHHDDDLGEDRSEGAPLTTLFAITLQLWQARFPSDMYAIPGTGYIPMTAKHPTAQAFSMADACYGRPAAERTGAHAIYLRYCFVQVRVAACPADCSLQAVPCFEGRLLETLSVHIHHSLHLSLVGSDMAGTTPVRIQPYLVEPLPQHFPTAAQFWYECPN
jgi:hypothetical protein